MKSLLPTLVASALATLAAQAGAPANNSVQIFKGTIKSKFEKLEAGASQKGGYSAMVYYIQSRSESTETVIGLNPKTKTFFIENTAAATFTLANNNKNLFNLRSIDLRDLFTGTGSLLGATTNGTFSGVAIDFHTPKLAYQFDSFAPAPGALYLSTHDKATLKIDKNLMKRAYEGGATTVADARTEVISFLAEKGYQGLP